VATLEYHSIGIDGGTYDYPSFNLFRGAQESRFFETEDVRAMARAEGDWSSTPDTGGFIGGAGDASPVGGTCGMGLTTDVANRHIGAVDATLYRITDIGVAGDASWLFDGIQCPKISGLFGNGYWARDCIGTDFGADTFVVDGGSGTVILHNCLTGKVRCFSGTMITVNCTFLNAATVAASQFFIAINCLSYFTHSFDDSFIGVFDLASSNNFSNDATAPGSGSGTISGDPFVGGGDYRLDSGDPEGLEGQGADASGFSPPVTLDAFGTTRPAAPTPGWFELDTGGGGDVNVNATGSSVTLTGASGQAAFASSIPSTGSAGALTAADGTVSVALGLAAVGSAVALAVAAGISTFSALFSANGSGATITAAAGQCTYASALTCTGSGATLTCDAGQAQYSSGDGSVNVTATGSACTITASAGQCTYGATFSAIGGSSSLATDAGTVAYAAFFQASGSQAMLTAAAGTTLYSLLLRLAQCGASSLRRARRFSALLRLLSRSHTATP
jgi:hypothetical protein